LRCILQTKQFKDNTIRNKFSTMEYKVSEKCQMPIYVRLAEQLCPRACATCCKTRRFNCRNVKISVGQCKNFTQEMCRTPSLSKIALEFCPHTCGLCDNIDGCENLRGFCHDDSIRNMCQRTCFSRACLQSLTSEFQESLYCTIIFSFRFKMTKNADSQSSGCIDAHVNCTLYRNLCNIGDYGIVMRTQCRRTCGHC
uniref:ShKT domain-containing protein n=1 Tax=Dracunculus medinensis TaxID=318479 RepID=A0A0N4URY7_DRAME